MRQHREEVVAASTCISSYIVLIRLHLIFSLLLGISCPSRERIFSFTAYGFRRGAATGLMDSVSYSHCTLGFRTHFESESFLLKPMGYEGLRLQISDLTFHQLFFRVPVGNATQAKFLFCCIALPHLLSSIHIRLNGKTGIPQVPLVVHIARSTKV